MRGQERRAFIYCIFLFCLNQFRGNQSRQFKIVADRLVEDVILISVDGRLQLMEDFPIGAVCQYCFHTHCSQWTHDETSSFSLLHTTICLIAVNIRLPLDWSAFHASRFCSIILALAAHKIKISHKKHIANYLNCSLK